MHVCEYACIICVHMCMQIDVCGGSLKLTLEIDHVKDLYIGLIPIKLYLWMFIQFSHHRVYKLR
jgi:hypothetical protein